MKWKLLCCFTLVCHTNGHSSASPMTPSARMTSTVSVSRLKDLSVMIRGGDDEEVNHAQMIHNGTLPSPEDYDSDAEFLESVLLSSNFGSGLQAEDLKDVIGSFEKCEYPKGSILFSEKDETADFLFVVESGRCAVTVDGQQLPAPYGIASPGSMVGELALVYDTRRVSTVYAKTDVSGFRLSRASFTKWLEKWPERKDQLRRDLKEIDQLLAKVSGIKTKYDGSVIRKFKPSRKWLWARWKGTILQHAWKISIANVLIATAVVVGTRFITTPTWRFGTMPDEKDAVISRMMGLFKVWEYLMTVTTFTLTFFLGQAYTLWRDIYSTARVVQGRLSDINLMLAVSAERDRNGSYTKRARELMDDVASYTRLYHVFMWASLSSKLNLILSDIGLRRMVSRGVLSRKQLNTLQKLDATTVAPQHACLIWIMTRFLKGMEDNVVPNDMVMKQSLFNKCMELQGTFAGVGGKLAGRSRLAYIHLVQVLVDCYLLLGPFALTCRLGVWGIPAVGILTLFYSGLLDLSKILLHPLGNDEDTYDESVNMDLAVIIRESNGASTRWMDGGEVLPF